MPGSHHCDTMVGLVMGLQIDNAQDAVGEPVEMRRDIGIAAASPPQPVDPESRHLQEGDLARLRGAGNVMDGKAGAERLAIGDAVGQRVLEIAAPGVVGLHGDDIGAVGEQQQIVRRPADDASAC